MEKSKVVILCGGMGTRMKEETEFKPKPMVLIGGKPILWHIMKIYSHYGYKDFILCLGYKGNMIKEYFLNHKFMSNDFTLNLNSKEKFVHNNGNDVEDWNITFADTGEETNSGGRIKKIQKYINEDNFLLTYGDGVSDIDIQKLVEYHKQKNKIATLTAIQPMSRFGVLKFDNEGTITSFREKPKLDGWVSGGFFILNKKVFDYIGENDTFETESLLKLSNENQIGAYPHYGFWDCMDTFKDAQRLNHLWKSNNAPWAIWKTTTIK